MLSNYERRELARIEQALREDPDWREPYGLAAGAPRGGGGGGITQKNDYVVVV